MQVMGLGNCKIAAALFVVLFFFCSDFGAAIGTITSNQTLRDHETIVSPRNIFTLGFFSPPNSTNRYVGIWYSNTSVRKTVWVANRNRPVNDSSGMVTISDDGNLVVLNGWREIHWSSNVSNGVSNSTVQLTDDGNLVLKGSLKANIVWQSFDQPCDTYLPNMKLVASARTGETTLLKSWLSPYDPSIGSFSAGINPLGIPEFVVWNNSRPFWRSGPWVGHVFIGIPEMWDSTYLNGFNLRDEGDGTFSMSLALSSQSSKLNYVLSSNGYITGGFWDYEMGGWVYDWHAPYGECDVYGKCGPFGSCNPNNSPICTCLRGFEPRNADEWNKGNWTGGCVRRTLLQCDRVQNSSEVGKRDGFFRLEMMKVPSSAEYWPFSSSEQECENECLNNCSCVACSYYSSFGCMSWTGDLIDIQKFSEGGIVLHLRLADSELEKKGNMKEVISISVVVGTITIFICAFFSWKWMAEHRERKGISEDILLSENQQEPLKLLDGNVLEHNIQEVQLQELPLFGLQILETATNNFTISLGQGGFGTVYKGKLPDGQEIGVKRLSRVSGQGLQEFMNEVMLISKLQHRNLVRLLGCCVEGEEMMLVYEYMPNKSLDAFLFDPLKKGQLGWKKRFNIIEGISRGLLYLHRDSRLRIIHRDLKPSNILLDHELNPKISDFGMARIFGNEDPMNTTRIVGTCGYMSPEYVMEGRFSEKSDVFSYGALLLEIVSGRRNTSFYGNENTLSLIGLAWKLWNEGNITALTDPTISETCFQGEIFRCIHVGLLCVQELAKDRPTVSMIISMLNGDTVDLSSPKRPAFCERQSYLDAESFRQSQKEYSINDVTVSNIKGR